MRISLEIKGLEDLERKLSRLPGDVLKKVIKPSLLSSARTGAAALRVRAPVRTGVLRRSVTAFSGDINSYIRLVYYGRFQPNRAAILSILRSNRSAQLSAFRRTATSTIRKVG